MARKPIIDASGVKQPVAHTTATIRPHVIPVIDAIVMLYRRNSGTTLTRTDVIQALIMDAHDDFVSAGLLPHIKQTEAA